MKDIDYDKKPYYKLIVITNLTGCYNDEYEINKMIGEGFNPLGRPFVCTKINDQSGKYYEQAMVQAMYKPSPNFPTRLINWIRRIKG